MAYSADHLAGPTYLGSQGGYQLWYLGTTDNNAGVIAAGYISDAGERGMEVGDIVHVIRFTTLPKTTPIDGGAYYVASIDAANGAATLAPSDALTVA